MKESNKKVIIPKPEPKLKKVPSGPLREKTRTINKIVSSVGKVLQKKRLYRYKHNKHCKRSQSKP